MVGNLVHAIVDGILALIRRALWLACSIELARQLVGLPRDLSQHVGLVLTRGLLDGHRTLDGLYDMDERTFIEWDKDDIDRLGIMQVDVPALGTPTCIRKVSELLTLRTWPSTDGRHGRLRHAAPRRLTACSSGYHAHRSTCRHGCGRANLPTG